MDLSLFARAVALGFTIAAGVGPISLLTVQRTVAHGHRYGLASGFGVALADGTYAALAAFGLTALIQVLTGFRTLVGSIGGVVILAIGLRTLRSGAGTPAGATDRPGLLGGLVSIYGLTLANPLTILSFMALFAALGLTRADPGLAATASAGVLVGSSLWWLTFTSAVAWARGRMTRRVMTWINRISGLTLICFGAATVAGTLLAAG
jgi:threonine/homoserine/homoserine lactone efflux protein